MTKKVYSLDDIFFIQRNCFTHSKVNDIDSIKYQIKTDICTLEPFTFGSSSMVTFSSLYDPTLIVLNGNDKDLTIDDYKIFSEKDLKNVIFNMVLGNGPSDSKKAISYSEGKRFQGAETLQNLYTMRSLFRAIKQLGVRTSGDYKNPNRSEIDMILNIFVDSFYLIDINNMIGEQDLIKYRDYLMFFDVSSEIIFSGYQRKRQ